MSRQSVLQTRLFRHIHVCSIPTNPTVFYNAEATLVTDCVRKRIIRCDQLDHSPHTLGQDDLSLRANPVIQIWTVSCALLYLILLTSQQVTSFSGSSERLSRPILSTSSEIVHGFSVFRSHGQVADFLTLKI